jgi:hypothetical protein
MSWAAAAKVEAGAADAGTLIGRWRLRRCLGHLAATGDQPAGVDVVAVAAPAKAKRKDNQGQGKNQAAGGSAKSKGKGKGKGKGRSKSKSKSKSNSQSKSSKSPSKAKGASKAKGKSRKKAQQTAPEDEAAPVGQVVGTIPPSVPRGGAPVRPWERSDQAQKVAETSEWLQQQRKKLGLDGGGFDVETLKKKKAERLKKGTKRKPGEEDPLIAKLKAMGETRVSGGTGDEPRKGKL